MLISVIYFSVTISYS